jgi:hypothetical protein
MAPRRTLTLVQRAGHRRRDDPFYLRAAAASPRLQLMIRNDGLLHAAAVTPRGRGLTRVRGHAARDERYVGAQFGVELCHCPRSIALLTSDTGKRLGNVGVHAWGITKRRVEDRFQGASKGQCEDATRGVCAAGKRGLALRGRQANRYVRGWIAGAAVSYSKHSSGRSLSPGCPMARLVGLYH